jgi:hypothetical protein
VNGPRHRGSQAVAYDASVAENDVATLRDMFV